MHTSNVIKQLPRRSRVLRGYSFHVGPKVTRNDPSWQAEAEAGGGGVSADFAFGFRVMVLPQRVSE